VRFLNGIVLYPLYLLSLNISTWNLCIPCLLTAGLFLMCHHQILASITICCPEWSHIKYTWIPSPVYQNIVKLIVNPEIRSLIQRIRPFPRLRHIINMLIFNGDELLAPCSTLNLVGHTLSVVCNCLFNIFAAILYSWRSSPPSTTWGCATLCWQVTHLTWRITSIVLILREVQREHSFISYKIRGVHLTPQADS
jgi:hypothetical protein